MKITARKWSLRLIFVLLPPNSTCTTVPARTLKRMTKRRCEYKTGYGNGRNKRRRLERGTGDERIIEAVRVDIGGDEGQKGKHEMEKEEQEVEEKVIKRTVDGKQKARRRRRKLKEVTGVENVE